MYEILTHLSKNPSQNFNKYSSILKNPKIFQKDPKPRFQNMNACKWKRLEAYQVKSNLKKLEKSLKKRFGVREILFGRWTGADRSREIEEMSYGSHKEKI